MYDNKSGDKEMRRQAKLKVLEDMRDSAEGMMKGDFDGLKKVSVMSDSEEGLKKGLNKAEDIVGQMPEMGHEMSPAESEEPSEEESKEPMSVEEIEDKIAKLEELKNQLMSAKS